MINESYPSLTLNIAENADRLAERLADVEAETIHFVTHSMGALVLRQMLSMHEVTALGRVVMIAPPSRGAKLADHHSRFRLYALLMGRSAMELSGLDVGSFEVH